SPPRRDRIAAPLPSPPPLPSTSPVHIHSRHPQLPYRRCHTLSVILLLLRVSHRSYRPLCDTPLLLRLHQTSHRLSGTYFQHHSCAGLPQLLHSVAEPYTLS